MINSVGYTVGWTVRGRGAKFIYQSENKCSDCF